MKYVTPNYDLKIAETEDFILASNEKYEITRNDDGSGNVIFTAFDIFSLT